MARQSITEPNIHLKKDMYKMYKDLFNSHFSERKKLNLMTAITGWEPWSWRVVGITIDAVGLVKENNGHSSSARELVRDHYFQGRTETYKKMLSKLLSFDDWWSEFWNNDRTILMTKEEHRFRTSESYSGIKKDYFEIVWQNGYFISGKVAGYLFVKKYEGDFILSIFGDYVRPHKLYHENRPRTLEYYSPKWERINEK